MKTKTPQKTPVTHEENQRLAYQLWEQANRPSDQALDFWLQAEQQLVTPSQQQQGQAARPAGNSKSNGVHSNPKAAKRTAKAGQSTQ